MESEFTYRGYPEWRKDGYKQQNLIWDQIVAGNEHDYEKATITQRIEFIIKMLFERKNSEMESLALVTKIRQEISKPDVTPDFKAIANDTRIIEVVSICLEKVGSTGIDRFMVLEATWILTNISFSDDERTCGLFMEDL